MSRTMVVVAGALFLAAAFFLFTSEYRGKRHLKKFFSQGMPLREFAGEYGEPLPRYTYAGWDSLPDDYRALFGQQSKEEEVFYGYQQEGLPSYWSFLISVDSDTRIVQRYVFSGGVLKLNEDRE